MTANSVGTSLAHRRSRFEAHHARRWTWTLPSPGLEQLALSRAERVDVEGTQVPVAHATDLVVMKLLAGRGKDLEDVRSLPASGNVDVSEARDLLGQLEEALGQSDLVPGLEQAIVELGEPLGRLRLGRRRAGK